ncbi:hypothetical protein DQ04_01431100 [Trypanosoma grayi]|uniref:hypothetical protein n=1 Tax=Trypanosoma grayi TaxID=71804 RepID=UPI0004F43437|nr:hypothetical protein DQ04_01431100 [Trypanosoma grayi]KEG12781.1 hypothetical protein DQ04_01431100 [Trypanosoma grayi]
MRCSSCCTPEIQSHRQGGKSAVRCGSENRRTLYKRGDVHERLFAFSRRAQCTCQAVLHNDGDDDSDDANCTFVPTVNRTHEALLSRWSEGVSVFERLYGNALFLQQRREKHRGVADHDTHRLSRSFCSSAAPHPRVPKHATYSGLADTRPATNKTLVISPFSSHDAGSRQWRSTVRTARCKEGGSTWTAAVE